MLSRNRTFFGIAEAVGVSLNQSNNNTKFAVFKRTVTGNERKLGLVMAADAQLAATKARSIYGRLLSRGEVIFVKEMERV